MIEEVKKKDPLPKKTNLFLRLVIFVVTLALVVGAIFLVANRDRFNFDALKRWFTYRTLAQSDTTGGGAPFAYQGGAQQTLTCLDGSLLVVSATGVRLYSPGGTAYVEDTVTLEHPACHVSGKSAVVYDAGGSFLRVYQKQGQVFALDQAATILSARLSVGGYLTVITRSSGYKGVATVYDASFKPLLQLNLSSSFILDGVVSPDNRSLLLVTAGQEEQFFSAALVQYSLPDLDLDAPVPTSTLELENHLPLDLRWDAGGIWVIAEHGAIATDAALAQTGGADWSQRYLKRFSLGASDVFAVLTGKYRSGSQTQLELIDRQGKVLGALEETRPILSLSASEKYVAVLTADELTIYTLDLVPYATSENTQNASQVALLPDGSAFLATGDSAWLYLPD